MDLRGTCSYVTLRALTLSDVIKHWLVFASSVLPVKGSLDSCVRGYFADSLALQSLVISRQNL